MELDRNGGSHGGAALLERATAPGATREDAEAAAVALLEEFFPVGQVARFLGVHRGTLWTWRQENPTFAEEWARAVTLGQDEGMMGQLRKRIVRGDTTGVIVGLKVRKLFVEDKGGSAVQVTVGAQQPTDALTTEGLRELLALARRQEAEETARAALPPPAPQEPPP